jgi:hypothetical protein
MSNVEKPMEVCVWCMEPAFAGVVPACSASNTSGKAVLPKSHARLACCCILSRLVLPRCTGRDWSRRGHRRVCMQLVQHQRIEVSLPPPVVASPRTAEVILSRAQRAHSRLSWAERLERNARVPTASQVTMRLFGVPRDFATLLGLQMTSGGEYGEQVCTATDEKSST